MWANLKVKDIQKWLVLCRGEKVKNNYIVTYQVKSNKNKII
jgi:hypothetical protein